MSSQSGRPIIDKKKRESISEKTSQKKERKESPRDQNLGWKKIGEKKIRKGGEGECSLPKQEKNIVQRGL